MSDKTTDQESKVPQEGLNDTIIHEAHYEAHTLPSTPTHPHSLIAFHFLLTLRPLCLGPGILTRMRCSAASTASLPCLSLSPRGCADPSVSHGPTCAAASQPESEHT